MTRLIDKEEVLKALETFSDKTNGNVHFLNGIESAKEIIKHQPEVSELRRRADALSEIKKFVCVRDDIGKNHWVNLDNIVYIRDASGSYFKGNKLMTEWITKIGLITGREISTDEPIHFLMERLKNENDI